MTTEVAVDAFCIVQWTSAYKKQPEADFKCNHSNGARVLSWFFGYREL